MKVASGEIGKVKWEIKKVKKGEHPAYELYVDGWYMDSYYCMSDALRWLADAYDK